MKIQSSLASSSSLSLSEDIQSYVPNSKLSETMYNTGHIKRQHPVHQWGCVGLFSSGNSGRRKEGCVQEWRDEMGGIGRGGCGEAGEGPITLRLVGLGKINEGLGEREE